MDHLQLSDNGLDQVAGGEDGLGSAINPMFLRASQGGSGGGGSGTGAGGGSSSGEAAMLRQHNNELKRSMARLVAENRELKAQVAGGVASAAAGEAAAAARAGPGPKREFRSKLARNVARSSRGGRGRRGRGRVGGAPSPAAPPPPPPPSDE